MEELPYGTSKLIYTILYTFFYLLDSYQFFFYFSSIDLTNIGIDDLVASLRVNKLIEIDSPEQLEKAPYKVVTLAVWDRHPV